MEITIRGGIKCGPSWVALQEVLRSMTNDDYGVLTQIARRGGGANYRDVNAVYDLTFLSHSDRIAVVLTVERPAAAAL